jgi:hypothetical protein
VTSDAGIGKHRSARCVTVYGKRRKQLRICGRRYESKACGKNKHEF